GGGSAESRGSSGGDMGDRLLPYLVLNSVVGQPVDVLGEPVSIAPLDRADDASMQDLAPNVEQGAVGDLMGERMLEGVFGIGEETCLVEELGRLQVCEPPLHRIRCHLCHRVQQYEGHVLPDD